MRLKVRVKVGIQSAMGEGLCCWAGGTALGGPQGTRRSGGNAASPAFTWSHSEDSSMGSNG